MGVGCDVEEVVTAVIVEVEGNEERMEERERGEEEKGEEKKGEEKGEGEEEEEGEGRCEKNNVTEGLETSVAEVDSIPVGGADVTSSEVTATNCVLVWITAEDSKMERELDVGSGGGGVEDTTGVEDAKGVEDTIGVENAKGVEDTIGVDDAIGIDDATGVEDTKGVEAEDMVGEGEENSSDGNGVTRDVSSSRKVVEGST